MAKLEGIIYKAFNQYVVLRGFAPIGDLAVVSKKPDAYQRPADDKHKIEIVKFLENRQYTYFPDVILACRARNYQDFMRSIGIDSAVDSEDSTYVDGLRVLRERLPFEGNRARHAFLNINSKILTRVDGNHRLEPFDEKDQWWNRINVNRDDIQNLLIPFTIIFSEEEVSDKFEAGIFHNINFKHLPLRQEASLRIISELNVFPEIEKLGEEYPLAMQLIELTKDYHFKGFPFLTPLNDDSKDVYRTACLRIVKLLIDRKKIIKIELEKYNKRITRYDSLTTEKKIILKSDYIEESTYERKIKEGKIDLLEPLDEYSSKKLEIETKVKKYEEKLKSLNTLKIELEKFLIIIGNIDEIELAIQSLRPLYESFDSNQGNLAMLAALVYYKLRDKSKYKLFADWIKKNGINKITTIDDLPIHHSNSLIEMFERIYDAKRRKVFISMQFGDDQSEMIYEKIVQTIDKYNQENNNGLDILVQPIRVDRTIAPHAFTISDEIMRAIKNSSLIIADLSSGNKNVYHEIGYAMGLSEAKGIQPPIVLLYKETTVHKSKDIDTDKFVGFNLRGSSQLRFRTYDELSLGLIERLKKHFEV